MGGVFWKSQAQLQTEELKKQTELLQKKVNDQEKMLKLIILNTKTLIKSLSGHIHDTELIKEINNLLDQQDKLLNENILDNPF